MSRSKTYKVRMRYTVEEVMEVEAENTAEVEEAAHDQIQLSPHGFLLDWEVIGQPMECKR